MDIKSYITQFGLKIFLVKAIRSPFYNNYSKFGLWISDYNEKLIKKFLYKEVFIDSYKKDIYCKPKKSNIEDDKVIWTMWWQGEKEAPKIVKQCIQKLRENNPEKKIIVIDKTNFKNFVELDSKIINLFFNKKISITHLSDIIRVNLLFFYGGCWVDSTIFSTHKIEDKVFKSKFYTINTQKYTNDPSHGRWTTFFLFSKKRSPLFGCLVQAFNIYFKKYSSFIDYILFDYFIEILYEHDDSIKKLINNVPKNNERVFELVKYLNSKQDKLDDFLCSDTYLYKLTYKKNFEENGYNTIYARIIK